MAARIPLPTASSLLTPDQARPTRATGYFESRTVDTIIVGGGPVGLFQARLLNGLACVHNRDKCADFWHNCLNSSDPTDCVRIPELSGRGTTLTGNWFDSFLTDAHDQNKELLPQPCLTFTDNPDRAVDWLLFSASSLGGSWCSFHPRQLSVSPALWMSLPDATAPGSHVKLPTCERILASALVTYYQNYASHYLPGERIKTRYRVESVTRQADGLWTVQGQFGDDKPFSQTCRNVVLATGCHHPNRLGVCGEDSTFVSHSDKEARDAISQLPEGSRVLIIGCGLSAADALICATKKKHQITHLIRTDTIETALTKCERSSAKPFSNFCGASATSEHADLGKVSRMVFQRRPFPDYRQIAGGRLLAVDKTGCLINDGTQEYRENFQHVAILIGAHSDFSLIKTETGQRPFTRLDELEVNTTTMETRLPGLYVAGYCAGEHFQKFGLGHTVFINRDIREKQNPK